MWETRLFPERADFSCKKKSRISFQPIFLSSAHRFDIDDWWMICGQLQ